MCICATCERCIWSLAIKLRGHKREETDRDSLLDECSQQQPHNKTNAVD